MNHEQLNSVNPSADINYRRKKNAEEMKHQVITFALMIFLTLVSFVAVSYEGFSNWFIIPFILLLAVIQVAYQLYYFMHMSHKGHGMVAIFMYSGVLIAFITVLAFVTIVWW
ncbi:cytochrome c oxidase subunit IVB [Bacillus sp. V3B]|uniref:cytochrome c oxidase subunit IVB n=1 Tax=Bacillus sp. V3B TaxID=2804915 RepID=UPI00210CDC54|nr:cytochrome c oxidase subunit IVB [Bacillus sp. V3B]MCQ6275137.1 cytochrome c oxidase subunit IVB [Bacillus sp. V3B]